MSSIPLTVLINESIASEALKNEVVEIVLRRKDAKYRSFIKCAIDTSVGKDKNILNTAMGVATRNSLSMPQINRMIIPLIEGIADNQEKLNHISSVARHNSFNIDSILKSTNVIKISTFLNTGLEIANIGVTIVGFAMMSRKLTLLDEELKEALSMMDVAEKRESHKFYARYHELIMQTNKALDSIKLGQTDIAELENLIISLNAFTENCVNDLKANTRDISDMLKMIFSLISPYTAILKSFLMEYYFTNRIFPANYTTFIGLYDLLLDTDLIKKEFKYIFLDLDKTNREAISILDAQIALVIDARTLITDYKTMLEAFKTREKMAKIDTEINNMAQKQAKEDASEVGALLNTSAWQCKQVMVRATLQ